MKQKKKILISEWELRRLVFWAVFGVESAFGGSYMSTIIPIIQKYADKSLRAESKRVKFRERRKSK